MAIVYWLLKFCQERSHAEEFIAGRLFLRKLSYFRALEEATDGRGDRLEGASHIWQPSSGMVMHFNDIRIPASDMAAAAFLTPNATLEHHALCVYAASSGPFPSLSKENIDEFREHMRVPARCAAMGGEHTVFIHQFKTFQDRIIAAAQREGFVITGGPVTYYDDVIHTGEMDPGFWKPRRFEWQRERRYLIDSRGRLSDPARLDIGSLADIATIVDLSTFNEHMRINLPE